MRVVIAAAVVGVVGLGAVTLWLAQPERGKSRPRLRVFTGAFLAALVATFALSVSQWSPPTANVSAAPVRAASIAQVLALVRESTGVVTIPADLTPSVAQAIQRPLANFGAPPAPCFLQPEQTAIPSCGFGDPKGTKTMVLYGDSHAAMWFDAFDAIAKRAGWRLIIISKGGCPASLVPVHRVNTPAGEDFVQCDTWHKQAMKRIDALAPDLLVVSQQIGVAPAKKSYGPMQWQKALTRTLNALSAKRKLVLGDIPATPGPDCLVTHAADVQACSRSAFDLGPYYRADHQGAIQAGATYVNITPWFCFKRCSPIIGHFNVYFDDNHVAIGYSEYLEGVLQQALGI